MQNSLHNSIKLIPHFLKKKNNNNNNFRFTKFPRQKFTKNIIMSKSCPQHDIKLIHKIATDTIIDGVCIYGKFTLSDHVSSVFCTSLFTSCIFNNILLNKNATSEVGFIHRGIQLFKFGLISNIVSAFIYTHTQTFSILLYLKYILFMSMGMGILSNIRYTIIYNFENHINASLHQSIFIRIFNNILGVIQQSTILTFV